MIYLYSECWCCCCRWTSYVSIEYITLVRGRDIHVLSWGMVGYILDNNCYTHWSQCNLGFSMEQNHHNSLDYVIFLFSYFSKRSFWLDTLRVISYFLAKHRLRKLFNSRWYLCWCHIFVEEIFHLELSHQRSLCRSFQSREK